MREGRGLCAQRNTCGMFESPGMKHGIGKKDSGSGAHVEPRLLPDSGFKMFSAGG